MKDYRQDFYAVLQELIYLNSHEENDSALINYLRGKMSIFMDMIDDNIILDIPDEDIEKAEIII